MPKRDIHPHSVTLRLRYAFGINLGILYSGARGAVGAVGAVAIELWGYRI